MRERLRDDVQPVKRAIYDGLISIREAFIYLVPVVIFFNLMVLLTTTLKGMIGLDLNQLEHFSFNTYLNFNTYLFPLFFMISLSFVLAAQRKLDKISVLLLVFSCVIVFHDKNIEFSGQTQSGLSIISVAFVAFLSVFLYGKLIRSRFFDFARNDGLLSSRMILSINNVIPMLLVTLFFVLLRWPLDLLAEQVIQSIATTFTGSSVKLSEQSLFVAHLLISQIGWFFGVHGPNVANDLFLLLQIPELELKSYFWAFAYMGGSGATFGLVLAILIFNQRSKHRLIAKFSLPFSFFNINEIMIYGLPIVLNPLFFIPFFMVPLINFGFSLLFLHYGWLEIVNPDVSWIVPPLVNIYQITGGSWSAVALQALVIVVDVLLYAPFVLMSMLKDDKIDRLFGLMNQDAGGYMQEIHHDQSERRFIRHQQENLDFIADVDRIFDQLNDGRFLLYFQPKYQIDTMQVCGLEVLLRLHDRHGEIQSPKFIDTLHQAGLSIALDRKVLYLVMHQIKWWEQQGLDYPMISMNIDKPFLLDEGCIKELLSCAKQIKTRLQIEITEHSYISDVDRMLETVGRLRAAGLQVAIDDFGAGYSCLTSLIYLNADEVKLDREFVLAWQRDPVAAQLLIQATSTLCHQLGFRVVIEGVETAEQLAVMQHCKIDVVQGYFTGRPMSVSDVQQLLQPSSRRS